MPLTSLPNECFINALSFLDKESLHKCLFVNRYYCIHSIPIIWREPYPSVYDAKLYTSVPNTLLACLNDGEISLLVPYAIKLPGNNPTPLFEYGKFVRSIHHDRLIASIRDWLSKNTSGPISRRDTQDCIIQGIVNVIYHMIIRQGSNLQKFGLIISQGGYYTDLPKLSTFMNYNGITNLRSLVVDTDLRYEVKYDDLKCQNIIELLNNVSKFCNGIVSFDLCIDGLTNAFIKPFLNIIKLYPLKSMKLCISNVEGKVVKDFLFALKLRSETLKELQLEELNFQEIDLSFLSNLEYLEHLEFEHCYGFTPKHSKTLLKKKLRLRKLKLWFYYYEITIIEDFFETMIDYFCSETLVKLSFNVVTLETVKAVKESCPNIRYLDIKMFHQFNMDLIIPIICELSSLKFLKIQHNSLDSLVKILGDFLTSVEYLFLDFYVDLPSFKYFTKNCKANLKRLNILEDCQQRHQRKEYLICVNDFQKIHNSLIVLGIITDIMDGFTWTNGELEIVGSLTNQGVEIVSYDELSSLF